MIPIILLTIDVEDWFQVENFRQYIPISTWSFRELRVEKNTHRLLDLLDSLKLQPSAISPEVDRSHHPRATFFILGWIAKRLPHLVREIHDRGHEVASHGHSHRLCNTEATEDLRRDLRDSKELLEDIMGAPVFGYRAPSFSINNEILELIAYSGYLYDSSYNSFRMHGRYGHMNLSQNGKKGIALQIPRRLNTDSMSKHEARNTKYETFFELPISNMKLANCILPWGGGAYFRLLPFSLFKIGVRSILKRKGAYLFYLHPWEVDPQQPRVGEAPVFFRFRHYTNLDKTISKLRSLIETFRNCAFTTCCDYLRLS